MDPQGMTIDAGVPPERLASHDACRRVNASNDLYSGGVGKEGGAA